MLIRRQEIQNPSLGQIQAFLDASQEVHFHAEGRQDIYAWVDRTLRHQYYLDLSRAGKGMLRRFVMKMTGFSRAQMTRLLGEFGETQAVHPSVYRRHRSPRRFTPGDVALLVEVDPAHGRHGSAAPRLPAGRSRPTTNCFGVCIRRPGMPNQNRKAVEMAGRGKYAKPNNGFPPFSPPFRLILGSEYAARKPAAGNS